METNEIEDFATEAMSKPAEDYARLYESVASGEASPTEAPLEARAPAAYARPTLVRCVGCRGSGYMRSQWSFLWGDNCWICAGWGRNLPDEPFRGPIRANPIRVIMQSVTSQEEI